MTSGRTEYYYQQQLSRVSASSSSGSSSLSSPFRVFPSYLNICMFVSSGGSPARRCRIWNARNVFEHERRPKQTYAGADKERQTEREFIVFVLRPCLFIIGKPNALQSSRSRPTMIVDENLECARGVLYNTAIRAHLYNSQRSPWKHLRLRFTANTNNIIESIVSTLVSYECIITARHGCNAYTTHHSTVWRVRISSFVSKRSEVRKKKFDFRHNRLRGQPGFIPRIFLYRPKS